MCVVARNIHSRLSRPRSVAATDRLFSEKESDVFPLDHKNPLYTKQETYTRSEDCLEQVFFTNQSLEASWVNSVRSSLRVFTSFLFVCMAL